MYILFIGFIINAFITVINSMPCDADFGWLEYGGKCFQHYNTAVPWSSAKGTCSMLRQALLATVDSPEINTFIQNNLTIGSDVWIGLSIPDISKSSWKWSDGGNTSHYYDWNEVDVTSACAVMNNDGNNRYWYTKPCTGTSFYVCEKEMTDNNCSGWFWFETHCYLFMTECEATKMAAARKCWLYNAYLISINSQHEADFIYSTIEKRQEYWIGLSPLKWVNGEAYQWNNWGDSGPNITNRCAYMNGTSGKWFSGPCEYISSESRHHQSYMCQRHAAIDFPTTSNVADEVDASYNTEFVESSTMEFVSLNKSNIQCSTGISKELLLTIVVPAVCGGLVVIIVIIVVCFVIRRRRRLALDSKPSEQAIYYNDLKKTRDNEAGNTTEKNLTKMSEPTRHVQSENAQTSSIGDLDRSTYEHISKDPYVNSDQVTAATYASLQ